MQISFSCIVSANLQLNFSLSLTIVAWHESEKNFVLLRGVVTTAWRNISNGPSFSQQDPSIPIFMIQKFCMTSYYMIFTNLRGKLIYYHLVYLRQGNKLEKNLNLVPEKKWKKPTAVSGCQSSLEEETSENFFRKSSSDRRTILQIFLPFKTTTFCCFEEKTFSFLASYTSFLFRDNPLNSGTIYGTLYCLPHLPTFPRKSKNHSVFLLLKLFQQY